MDTEIKNPINSNLNSKNSFSELWKFILITVLIVLPIRLFVAKPFIVNGASMDPTFKSGQYLIVDELSFHFRAPKRGEVVVFQYPHDTSRFYIKRIVGLPGETVKIQYGKVSVQPKGSTESFTLDESYIVNASADTANYTLGDHEYFVLGDNRPASSDSRAWGNLDIKYIVGRPAIRLFPPSSFSLIPGEHLLPISI